MVPLKIIGRIILIVFLIASFVLGTMFYESYKRTSSVKKSNQDISIWQMERNEVYSMEQIGFAGTVTKLSPGLHRHDIDTITVKLHSWTSSDISFKGKHYLQRTNDSTLLLFISYSESIWPPRKIEIGDKITKDEFGFDFSVFNSHEQLKKKLSLLFCFYENPDTIIQKGNFLFGLYGKKTDTLFSGIIDDGKRNGIWRYYQAHTNKYKILEGSYVNDKRDGIFRKYYELSNN